MVNYTKDSVEKTRRLMQYVKEHQDELPPVTITVQLEKKDDYLSSASHPGSDLIWYSDEPRERGGQGKAPGPLSYALSSMGFCQFVHYTEHAIVEGIKLRTLQMKIDGKISQQKPRRFTEVVYEVSISSDEKEETIRDLAMRAAEDCYVTNTLKRACPVTGVIIHNGKKIDEHH